MRNSFPHIFHTFSANITLKFRQQILWHKPHSIRNTVTIPIPTAFPVTFLLRVTDVSVTRNIAVTPNPDKIWLVTLLRLQPCLLQDND